MTDERTASATTSSRQRDIRLTFEAEMDHLRSEAVRMGALVLENTKRLSEAILENRLDLAQAVIEADEEINALYADLERSAFMVIARQAPVASDLRFLISMTRILYDIERSGDLAVNCAKGLIFQDGYELPPALHSVLARLFAATTDIFAKGLDTIADMDPTAGVRLDEEDDIVDDLTEDYYRYIISEPSFSEDIDLAIELSRSGRFLERIADHAVNVAEHICFIVTGSFPANTDSAVTADED